MTNINKQDHRQAEAARQSADDGANLARRGVYAGIDTMRRASERTNETVRRSAEAALEGQRKIVQDWVQICEEVSRKMTEASRSRSEDTRRFFLLPQAAESGLRDVQQGMTGLVEGVVQTNLRTAQELSRLANPVAMVELQQRFVREYVDVLMQGTATLVRAVRRTADDTLRPLEEQVQQRRQEERYRDAAE